jgi:hypothetical protein
MLKPMDDITKLEAIRRQHVTEVRVLVELTAREDRPFTPAERVRFETIRHETERLEREVEAAFHRPTSNAD